LDAPSQHTSRRLARSMMPAIYRIRPILDCVIGHANLILREVFRSKILTIAPVTTHHPLPCSEGGSPLTGRGSRAKVGWWRIEIVV